MDDLLLYTHFAAIYRMTNPFEQYQALMDFKKDYKTSSFYKKYHYSIKKAYYIFCQHKATTVHRILINLANVDTLTDSINTVLDGIAGDSLSEALVALADKLDVTDLLKQGEELKTFLSKIPQ